MVYKIAPQVAVESFEDGALVLKLADRSLTELNPTARDVLDLTDGIRSMQQIAEEMARAYEIPLDVAIRDESELYERLIAQQILERVLSPQEKDGSSMNDVSTSIQYLCNPDVVLREEDEDGGLLFNPDTNQVKVINSTGLFIWKQFGSAQEVPAVIAAIQAEFEDVPQEAVAADVQTFLDEMLQTGFIGVVEAA
jgi:hypothetical protein